MPKFLLTFGLLLFATVLESCGDATVRIGLFSKGGATRIGFLLAGGLLLFGYGLMLNLAPLPFERIVGLYIAMLFCVWQIVTFVTFRTTPSLPVVVGGALIVAGGLLVTFWTRHAV